jgi:signal peptidase I
MPQYETVSFWYPTTGRRVLAILLSALLPGAGQAVLGRRGWAVFWVLASLVAIALEPAFGVWAAGAVLLLRLPASVQAAFMRGGGVAPDPNGKAAALVVLLVIGWAAAFTQLQHDVVENVTMVDATMYPTLEAGDLTLVDKTAYGLRLPFVGKLSPKPAQVGDVVAVDDPDKPDQLLVGRVVAAGPTSFEMKDGALVLAAGKEVTRSPLTAPCVFMEPDQAKRNFVDQPCTWFEEKLPNGRTWLVAQPPAGTAAPSTTQVRQVGPGQLLIAQDNRRGAAPWKIVPADSVRGRVSQVWFSTAGPRGIRWDRTDKRVH